MNGYIQLPPDRREEIHAWLHNLPDDVNKGVVKICLDPKYENYVHVVYYEITVKGITYDDNGPIEKTGYFEVAELPPFVNWGPGVSS